ncbi:MAG TPA: AmmeMemoRadiSam system protein A [Spirochaetia bacterium]|jgi:AmmeMemoRadiSam system protein A|nr:AmmeMemoRadiSam system protein A [Spirochaetia bacterium]
MAITLTDEEKLYLLKLARETIAARLERRTPEAMEEPKGALMEYCGAFVTIHLRGALRGCIGQMTGVRPLFETVREMAIASAFQDPRFPPLTREEFQSIDIEISVLTPLERIEDVNTVEVGKHGLYMKRGYHSGVLLPQVPLEQGWDRETFLAQTCRKAGMESSCYLDPKTEIYTFEAIVFGEKER